MILNQIIWDVNPEAFSIGDHPIRWYGLLLATGFYFAYFLLQRILKREKFTDEKTNLLAIFIFAGTIIGLRLGHCFFYEPGYYLEHPLEIFKVWEGGLASHGAAAGILLAVYLFSRKEKLAYISLLDKVVIIIPLAGAMVRIGNLMNSEIYGDLTSMPWGFVFPVAGQTAPRHPTQIYEALCYLSIFGILLWLYYKKNAARTHGLLFGWFLVLLFSARFFIEFIKDVQVNFEKGMPLNMGQLLSIPLIATGAYLIYRASKNKSTPVKKNTGE